MCIKKSPGEGTRDFFSSAVKGNTSSVVIYLQVPLAISYHTTYYLYLQNETNLILDLFFLKKSYNYFFSRYLIYFDNLKIGYRVVHLAILTGLTYTLLL